MSRHRQRRVNSGRTTASASTVGRTLIGGALIVAGIATVAGIEAMTPEEREAWLEQMQGDKTCNRCDGDEFKINSRGKIECKSCELVVGDADTWAV
jgi:hypothetical protein